MSVDPRTNAVANGARSVLRANPDATTRLPSPAEEFRLADLPREVARVFKRFREHGVIDRVGRTADGANTYRTDSGAYEVAREIREDRSTLPCGHGGMRNVRGGDYTCGNPDCDARYDRETVADAVFA